MPDIALDADPNVATPVKVYVGKTVSYVGGTSLSSPMMLGLWARMESAHGNSLGLASIALYRVYDKVNPGTPATTRSGFRSSSRRRTRPLFLASPTSSPDRTARTPRPRATTWSPVSALRTWRS